MDDPLQLLLGSIDSVQRYCNNEREATAIIEGCSNAIINFSKRLDDTVRSEVAYLILVNNRPPLSQLILDDPQIAENLSIGLRDDSRNISLYRPVEILTRALSQTEIEISDSPLYDVIVRSVRFCRYPLLQEFFRVLLLTAPHTDAIQACLLRAGIISKLADSFKSLDQLNVKDESDQKNIYGLCIITSYAARSTQVRNFIFTDEFLQSNVFFYYEEMSDFIQSARWTLFNSLISNETEGYFVSSTHNFLQECVENIGRAVSDKFHEYAVKCIRFLQFFLTNHAEELVALQLPEFFASLMNTFPGHYYLIDAIEDFFVQAIVTPVINEQMTLLLRYFADALSDNCVNKRSFALNILMTLREKAGSNQELADIMLAVIPGEDPVWERLCEIDSICETRAVGAESL
jgi:hypothetical protein